MIVAGAVGALVLLVLLTQVGVMALDRKYPAQGRMVDVSGARIHAIELGSGDAPGPPIVLIHGATSNLGTMRVPLGDELAKTHRVILIDRPGHGWSTRDNLADSSPAMQARQIAEALEKLGIGKAIIVVHSLAGVLAPLMALDHAPRVAGLVMLSPVTYRWRGGVGGYNQLVTTPVIGPLLANTVTLPLGLLLIEQGTRSVFQPQIMPDGYVQATMVPLLLRPREFLANAWDLVTLKAAVVAQSPRYGDISVPVTVITGDSDSTVSPEIHSKPFVAAVPGARLVLLPGVGHMVPAVTVDVVIREIDAMIAALDRDARAAMR